MTAMIVHGTTNNPCAGLSNPLVVFFQLKVAAKSKLLISSKAHLTHRRFWVIIRLSDSGTDFIRGSMSSTRNASINAATHTLDSSSDVQLLAAAEKPIA